MKNSPKNKMKTNMEAMIKVGYMDFTKYMILSKERENIIKFFDVVGWLCNYDCCDENEKLQYGIFYAQEEISLFHEVLEKHGLKSTKVFEVFQEDLTVDDILDKISKEGIDNLDFRERNFLNFVNKLQ